MKQNHHGNEDAATMRARAASLALSGMGVGAVAAVLGISRHRVYRMLRASGLDSAGQRIDDSARRKINALDDIRHALRAGHDPADIADICGVPLDYVMSVTRRAPAPARPLTVHRHAARLRG